VVRGVSLPSPIDLTRRPYNTGHTTVWSCDRIHECDGRTDGHRMTAYAALAWQPNTVRK